MATDTITSSSSAQGLTEADLTEAARGPSSFSVEGLSQSNRPLSELIAADKYLRKRRLGTRRNPLSGLVSKVVIGG